MVDIPLSVEMISTSPDSSGILRNNTAKIVGSIFFKTTNSNFPSFIIP
jgi:hypothetical protein